MIGFKFNVEGRVVWPVEAHLEREAVPARRQARYAVSDLWVLDYSIVDCGECRTELTDWMPRPAGIAHLYPPARRYMERRPPERYGGRCYIKFGGENPNLRRVVTNSGGFARIVDDGRLGELMKRAIRAAQQGNSNYYGCVAEFSKIVELLENLPGAGGPDYLYSLSPGAEPSVSPGRNVRAYLERSYREHVTIGAIARALGVSESKLSHRYRAECGESVFDTLLRIRVEQSLPLLLKNLPLKVVAAETGFNSEFYYSKVFKRHFGVSPARYRKNAADGT